MTVVGEIAVTDDVSGSGRGLRPRNLRGGGSEGGTAPLRLDGRRLGFEYHSIGRKPVYPA
jgi:hypothetical protein